MHAIATTMMLLTLLVPTKTWFTPQQPVTVQVKTSSPIKLALTDLLGNPQDGPDTQVTADKTINVEEIYRELRTPGTYFLYAVPADKSFPNFVGTPLVISVRPDNRRNAPPGPMVTKVEPLQYAEITTDLGILRAALYYDVAPNTVTNFINLSTSGFYDGLTFNRVIPNFLIQTGDPRGDGSGSAGYSIDAEFSDRPHLPGVLSMARMTDPNEPRIPPRPEFANSAGTQFFICLDYTNTSQLDGRYTAFGQITDGLNIIEQIGKTPIADPRSGTPQHAIQIRKIEIKPVTPAYNPYLQLKVSKLATTRP